jgi:ADP-heptose:LPS heptosyltransferase
MKLVQYLGLPTQGEHLDFPLGPDDFRSLDAIEGFREMAERDYICLHPGASVPERRWSTEWFAGIGAALAQQGFELVLTGSAAELN